MPGKVHASPPLLHRAQLPNMHTSPGAMPLRHAHRASSHLVHMHACTKAYKVFRICRMALLKAAPLALLGRGRIVVLLCAAAAAAVRPAAGRRGARAGTPPRRWAVSRPLRVLVLARPAAAVRADPPPAGAAAAAASALARRQRMVPNRGRHPLARGGPSATGGRRLPVRRGAPAACAAAAVPLTVAPLRRAAFALVHHVLSAVPRALR